MANLKVQAEDKQGKKMHRQANPLQSRQGKRRTESGAADYSTATPGWLAAAIIAVSKAGGAIQFGYSRDGGVCTIVILIDGDIEKNYVKPSENIDAFLEGVYRDFTSENPTDVVE